MISRCVYADQPDALAAVQSPDTYERVLPWPPRAARAAPWSARVVVALRVFVTALE
jgi:hypothetical protein